MTKKIQIARDFSFEAVQYASQGNAILGIRDSGKSYTATLIAEQLLKAGIPFIAFDPIGVWRFLKQGRDGAGFAVVVAGGEGGDIELTPESAPLIVRAAMRENIPLVLDLYSMNLSKADWKKIVADSIRLLLYENKPCGMRHIFIEEAAEFCPQRVGPDAGAVYAEIEKLARMGGNASLGYTLINQRAEEVNKAVLELCDCLILHRQKGRHSLTALGKWLDVADASNSREVIKSLPGLGQGKAWVWQQGSSKPKQIQVMEKTTLHPDRRKPLTANEGIPAEVGDFVSILKESLTKMLKTKLLGDVLKDPKRVAEESTGQDEKIQEQTARILQLEKIIAGVRKILKPEYDALRALFESTEVVESARSAGGYEPFLEKLPGKNREMLKTLIEAGPMTRDQLAFRVGMSPGSGSFATYLGKLRSLGLTDKQGDQIVLRNL